MSDAMTILFWWLMFGGTHVLGSSVPVRTFLTDKLGTPGFKGLYSIVSFATFIPLCAVYFNRKHAGALLFAPPAGFDLAVDVLMLFAFIVLFQGLATPSPLTTAAEMSGVYPDRARGIQRITRHPLNASFALFGLAHLPTDPYVGDWIFFGGFIVYGVLSATHQDHRTLASNREEIRRFQQVTSLLPFAAILSGKQRLALAELNRPALAAAVALFVVLRVFHGSLFGGPPA